MCKLGQIDLSVIRKMPAKVSEDINEKKKIPFTTSLYVNIMHISFSVDYLALLEMVGAQCSGPLVIVTAESSCQEAGTRSIWRTNICHGNLPNASINMAIYH